MEAEIKGIQFNQEYETAWKKTPWSEIITENIIDEERRGFAVELLTYKERLIQLEKQRQDWVKIIIQSNIPYGLRQYDCEQVKSIEEEIEEIQNNQEYKTLWEKTPWSEIIPENFSDEEERNAAIELLVYKERLIQLEKQRQDWMKIIQSANNKPKTSSRKQIAYTKMSVEKSGEKYLDAVAEKLGLLYNIPNTYGTPTMRDVLNAKESSNWEFRLLFGTPKRLPELFSPEQWDLLVKFDCEIHQRIHDGILPMSNGRGRPYVVVGELNYEDDFINGVKQIAVVVGIVSKPEEFLVKNENEF